MILVIDNVRSAHNVGSLFRTADAVGVEEIYLIGITPLPIDRFGRDDKTIAKTALGAQHSISWKHSSLEMCTEELKKRGYRIVVLEQTPRSYECFEYIPPHKHIALVVGNEVSGVSDIFLEKDYDYIEIAMSGKKESLNVSVAGGIALYTLAQKLSE